MDMSYTLLREQIHITYLENISALIIKSIVYLTLSFGKAIYCVLYLSKFQP